MDATRPRRTRDPARRTWYAQDRQRRFARFLTEGVHVEPPHMTRRERAA